MATITLTNDLQNGTTADADEVMENFEDITNECNGSLDADNVDFAVAPVIGGTTPAAGTFTTLTANTSLVIGGGTYDKTRYINLTPAGAIIPGTNGAALAQTDGTNFSYWTLAFDKTTDENTYWQFICPDTYDDGSVVVNVYYKTTVTSGAVVFYSSSAGRAEGEALDYSLGTLYGFDADTVPGTAGKIGVVSVTADFGWAAGDYVCFRLYRDANNASDTADADISVAMVEIEWEVA